MANFSFNKVILGGRLTATPELKKTQSGKSVTTFNVAVNRKGNTDGAQEADFITCTAWEKQAEFVTKYFGKGSSICIVGTLRNRSFTDKNGQKRVVTEILVQEVNFVDSKSEVSGGTTATYQVTATAPTPPMSSTESMAQIAGFTPSPKFESLADNEELPF